MFIFDKTTFCQIFTKYMKISSKWPRQKDCFTMDVAECVRAAVTLLNHYSSVTILGICMENRLCSLCFTGDPNASKEKLRVKHIIESVLKIKLKT